MKAMKIVFSLSCYVALLLCAACTSHHPAKPLNYGFEITEAIPDKKTAMVKQNLLHLAQVYDLKPVLFNKKIITSSTPVPTNGNSLFINTMFFESPSKLLSQLLHAEVHAWVMLNRKKVSPAVIDLKVIYPKIAGETIPGDKVSGYVHLIICYLELKLLEFYLGEKQSKMIIGEFIKKDKILPWTYYQVINKNFAIKQVVEKHQLLPPPLI